MVAAKLDAPLTVCAFNTHVGTAIASGGLRWLLAETTPDIVLLSEVQSPLARMRLRLVMPRWKWSAVGFRPVSRSRGASGTIVLARRKRLKLVTGSNRLVSKYRDRMHPERRTTLAWMQDRQTGRGILAIPMHTWSLFGGDPAVRTGHMAQINRYAAACKGGNAQGDLVIAGGDVNERVTGDGTKPIEEALRGAGMVHTRPWTDNTPSLDDIWQSRRPGRTEETVRNYRRVRVPFPGVDHPAVIVDIWP